MSKRILLIHGHPDATHHHFCHALENAYAYGATAHGHDDVRRFDVARPGFAFSTEGKNPLSKKGLTSRSARVVVTMGMPAAIYRWYFQAHSIKSLERNILGFVGNHADP